MQYNVIGSDENSLGDFAFPYSPRLLLTLTCVGMLQQGNRYVFTTIRIDQCYFFATYAQYVILRTLFLAFYSFTYIYLYIMYAGEFCHAAKKKVLLFGQFCHWGRLGVDQWQCG